MPEFFKWFKPETKNKNPEKPTYVKDEEYMDKVIQDQKSFKIKPEYSQDDSMTKINKTILTRDIIGNENTFVEKDTKLDKHLGESQAELDYLYQKDAEIETDINKLETNINDAQERLRIFAEEMGRSFSTSGVTLRQNPNEKTLTINEQRLMNYIKTNKKELLSKKTDLQEVKDTIKGQETLQDGGKRYRGGFMN